MQGRRGVGKASPRDRYVSFSPSSSVVHVPGVNDIQSSSSTGQNMSQISRQLNQSQVAWTGSRPPFPGQVRASVRAGHPDVVSPLAPWVSQRSEPDLTTLTTAGQPGTRAGGLVGTHGARAP